MIGTIINALGIIIGGVVGLTVSRQISASTQTAIKLVLGLLVVYVGLSTAWGGLQGTLGEMSRQLLIVLVSLMLGNLTGFYLRLQQRLNRLGRYAKEHFEQADSPGAQKFSEGFVTCSLLFCVGPMAFLGALQDGLTGDYRTLAVKAVMDGLSTLVFVTTFGWGAMLAVVPVVAYQGTITLLARYAAPFLDQQDLLNAINATGGFLIFCIAFVILNLKRIQLANYLPSLVYAPLITWLWR